MEFAASWIGPADSLSLRGAGWKVAARHTSIASFVTTVTTCAAATGSNDTAVIPRL